MRITWYGHAAFLLEGAGAESDVRVVLDPYRAPDVGTYAPIDDVTDIVAVSHENQKYHSFVAGLRGRTPDGPHFTWERTDRVSDLKSAAGRR